jgi:ABC-type Fe3+-hydroxamate transport system substrate-binding protein
MSTVRTINTTKKWIEKLAEKPFIQFTEEDKKQLKADYLRIEELVKSYTAGNPEIVVSFQRLKTVLEEQEGFFWLSV